MSNILSTSVAFEGEGSYAINQTFPLYNLSNEILSKNLTKALQVKYSVRDLNYKIGVVNDSNGVNLVSNYSQTTGYLDKAGEGDIGQCESSYCCCNGDYIFHFKLLASVR